MFIYTFVKQAVRILQNNVQQREKQKMKRTKNNSKKVNAIFTADWHLREDSPICRTDNFQNAQWNKVDFISDLQRKYNCPIIHAGDLFDHWKPSPYLLTQTIQHLPERFWTIYGNHDLPQHNLELAYKTGINTLEQACLEKGFAILYDGVHWLQEPNNNSYLNYFDLIRKVCIWHVMTYQGKQPWPNCTDLSAKQILEKYPQFDLIVTGHNHTAFVEELDGRLLVNPGSLTRQEADKEKHKPRVYLYYMQENKVTPVYLPIKQDVISREHIEKIEQRDNRISAFVERLNTEWETSLSFEENLERFEKENNIRKSVMQLIRKAIEDEKE